MKFEDIFKNEGLYKADSFAKGVAFKIEKKSMSNELELYTITYKNKSDISPDKIPTVVYSGLFKKEYKSVLTRSSLF